MAAVENLRLQMKPFSLAYFPSYLVDASQTTKRGLCISPLRCITFFINFTVNLFPISFVYARWTRWFPFLRDTALGTGAQTMPSLQQIPHGGLSWKEGKRAGSALSFPFTLPYHCKWELQPCIPSLPPSGRTVANARAAQLGCVPTTSTMAYRAQLLRTLPASNAVNLAFHLEELLQRSSWWHSPVSSGK